MTSIADKLTEVGQRIAETERRIAELKLAPTAEGLLLIETASAVLGQLCDFQKRLGVTLRLLQSQ